MELVQAVLDRLRILYPNLEINLWTKEDKSKILVYTKVITTFNSELMEKQLQKFGQELLDETVRNFSEFIEKKYIKRQYRIGVHGRPNINLTESQIKFAIANTRGCTAAANFLGIAKPTFKKYALKYGLYYEHRALYGKGVSKTRHGHHVPMQDIFDNLHPNYTLKHLKYRLIDEHYLEAKCEECGYDKKRMIDNQLPLTLDFRDGDRKNFSKENLRLICYCCAFHLYGKTNVRRSKMVKFDLDSRMTPVENAEVYDDLFDQFNKK